ncbi:hypothetical protein WA026_001870 [Henosepilachna vigintioctopunctata]|uniref:Uncharacterized protein n=1 Tax=Henosepilachna vigintioctopunctata TaxID=420089 RepID=A0AAW1UUN7_9CUCU
MDEDEKGLEGGEQDEEDDEPKSKKAKTTDNTKGNSSEKQTSMEFVYYEAAVVEDENRQHDFLCGSFEQPKTTHLIYRNNSKDLNFCSLFLLNKI